MVGCWGAQWLWAATMGQQLSGLLDVGDICLHSVSQFALVKQMINEMFQKWAEIPKT